MRGPGLLVAVWLVAALLPSVSLQSCQRPPQWTVDGRNLMEETRGRVTVVALLLAT